MDNMFITPTGFSIRRLTIQTILRLVCKDEHTDSVWPKDQYYIDNLQDTLVKTYVWQDDDMSCKFDIYILLGDLEVNANGRIVFNKVSSDVTIRNVDTKEEIAEHSCDFDIDVENSRYMFK